MPWVLIPGALRRLRNARRLDWEEAAEATGLRIPTVRLHESKIAPRCIRLITVEAYEKGYQCSRLDFAKWADYGAEGDEEGGMVMPAGTLQLRAEQEQLAGGANAIEIGGQNVELLGAVKIQRVNTAPRLYADHAFGWYGRISKQSPLPEVAARILTADPGVGALFRIERKIGKEAAIYITAFTRSAEHTHYMMDCADAKKRATALVRVFFKPAEADWKGFFPIEKPQRPRPFCYVVEKIAG